MPTDWSNQAGTSRAPGLVSSWRGEHRPTIRLLDRTGEVGHVDEVQNPGGWSMAIDVGTTAIAAATGCGNAVTVVQLGSSPYLPSAVCLDDAGELLTGSDAIAEALRHPERAELTPKKALADRERTRLGSRTLPTCELVAAILRRVAGEARRRHRNTSPTRVVLTHPTRWDPDGPELRRLRAAARSAALGEVELMPEPVAAARHYVGTTTALSSPGPVAVYDLGGGTFDVAVLSRRADGFHLDGPPGGDPHLGGNDFDAVLHELLEHHARARDPEAWEAVWSTTGRSADRSRAVLRSEITGGKEALSRRGSVDVYVPGFDDELRVTRAEYDAAIDPLIETTIDILRDTLIRAGTEPSALAALYLTGGASRTPLIATRLSERLGILPTTADDPKTVIVQGALANTGETSNRHPGLTSATDPAGGRVLRHSAFATPNGPMPPKPLTRADTDSAADRQPLTSDETSPDSPGNDTLDPRSRRWLLTAIALGFAILGLGWGIFGVAWTTGEALKTGAVCAALLSGGYLGLVVAREIAAAFWPTRMTPALWIGGVLGSIVFGATEFIVAAFAQMTSRSLFGSAGMLPFWVTLVALNLLPPALAAVSERNRRRRQAAPEAEGANSIGGP